SAEIMTLVWLASSPACPRGQAAAGLSLPPADQRDRARRERVGQCVSADGHFYGTRRDSIRFRDAVTLLWRRGLSSRFQGAGYFSQMNLGPARPRGVAIYHE